MSDRIHGFVGVGRMGTPMTTRLLNAGHKVVIYDTNSEAVGELGKLGAQTAMKRL